jgi:hypothetical protein
MNYIYPNLSLLVEEFIDDELYLVEEAGVKEGRHLVTDELLDVLLDLRAKALVVAHQQLQQVPHEPGA